MYGICASGGYIPRNRLSRKSMYGAMGWYNAANIAYAGGERSVANFDEDSITMAVAAVRATLPKGGDRSSIDGLYFASMSQVYPWDRGTNFAVEIGRRAAKMMIGQSS